MLPYDYTDACAQKSLLDVAAVNVFKYDSLEYPKESERSFGWRSKTDSSLLGTLGMILAIPNEPFNLWRLRNAQS